MTDRREVAPCANVELAGANTVEIQVGAPRSVSVTGDDNLVGRVTTDVRAGRLVIDDTGSFTTRAPMRVAVSVPSLDGVEVSGAGTVTVDGVTSADFSAEAAGMGTLVISGPVQRVQPCSTAPARSTCTTSSPLTAWRSWGDRDDPDPRDLHARRDADRDGDDPVPGRPDGDHAQHGNRHGGARVMPLSGREDG